MTKGKKTGHNAQKADTQFPKNVYLPFENHLRRLKRTQREHGQALFVVDDKFHVSDKFPVIGVGGIMTAEQARQMLDAGASLIEICTGFIYEGPAAVKKILKKLK